MPPRVRPRIAGLGEVPDPRGRRGRRQPLAALLALSGAALLGGWRRSSAIAEWGRTYGADRRAALGVIPPPPCAAPLFHAFRRRHRADLAARARLGDWAAAVVPALPMAGDATARAVVARDGTTLRGSRAQGAPGAHRRSAVSQRLGLTLAPTGVGDTTNAITAAPASLAGRLRRGRVVTVAALLRQRQSAQTIRDGGGDSVSVVKENHPEVHAAIALSVASPRPSPTRRGRRPRRGSTATAAAPSAGCAPPRTCAAPCGGRVPSRCAASSGALSAAERAQGTRNWCLG